ncbi:hypothetical protein EDB19DRAFT_4485 [Suillus lakei]|nr:hypothetical protein EDB19DRAFT_4485 [Suillus lakei]
MVCGVTNLRGASNPITTFFCLSNLTDRSQKSCKTCFERSWPTQQSSTLRVCSSSVVESTPTGLSTAAQPDAAPTCVKARPASEEPETSCLSPSCCCHCCTTSATTDKYAPISERSVTPRQNTTLIIVLSIPAINLINGSISFLSFLSSVIVIRRND